jgi:N-acetylneuraminate synthase
MSGLAELDAAVGLVRRLGVPVSVLQCTSMYPCPPERVGIQMLDVFRERFQCHVGLSDHSGTIFPGLAAATLGCEVLEVHVALSREMFGPDVPSSVTTQELRQLVEGVRFIETMRANMLDKNQMAEDLSPLRDLFTKSVVARAALPAGLVLTADHLTTKKPGTGIAAARLPELVGRRLKRSVDADTLLSEADLEDRP